MKDYAELFEDTRETVLDALADAIENHYRHQKHVEELEPDDEPPADGPVAGDFLYDFTRLNVQYFNQLARLGSSYSAIGSRVLEKLYAHYLPLSPRTRRPPRGNR
jgi:hypothetical protein